MRSLQPHCGPLCLATAAPDCWAEYPVESTPWLQGTAGRVMSLPHGAAQAGVLDTVSHTPASGEWKLQHPFPLGFFQNCLTPHTKHFCSFLWQS